MNLVSVSLTREQFVSYLGNKPFKNEPVFGFQKPKKGGVVVLHEDGALDRVPVVVVPANEMRDFYAFATTYVGTFFPFSAFFRVLPTEVAELLSFEGSAPPIELARSVIGMVLGEAFVQVGGRRLDDISLQACLATQSAVGASVITSGYDPHMVFAALDRWQTVRAQLNLENSRAISGGIRAAWIHILVGLTDASVGGEGEEIDQAIARLIRGALLGNGTADIRDLRDVAGFFPSDLLDFDGLSREGRVRAFDKAMDLTASLPQLRRDVVRGYLAAQVAGGSFSYMSMASHASAPLAPLWFGLFASMHPDTDFLVTANCLGRHVQKRLGQAGSLTSPIDADLSFEECLMLIDENRLARIRTDQQSVIRVELFPNVVGRFRLDREPRRDASSVSAARVPTSGLKQALARALAAIADYEEEKTSATPLFGDDILPKVTKEPTSKRNKSKPR